MKHSLGNIKIALATLVLVAMACVCGNTNNGVKIGEVTPPSVSVLPATSAPAQVTIYKTGDLIQLSDGTVVMNSAAIENNVLHANFTIENKGSTEMNISSILSFSAKDSEGVVLEQDYFNCGTSMDGTILPSDKLKGDICWKVTSANPVKIYFEENLYNSGAVVWEVSQ